MSNVTCYAFTGRLNCPLQSRGPGGDEVTTGVACLRWWPAAPASPCAHTLSDGQFSVRIVCSQGSVVAPSRQGEKRSFISSPLGLSDETVSEFQRRWGRGDVYDERSADSHSGMHACSRKASRAPGAMQFFFFLQRGARNVRGVIFVPIGSASTRRVHQPYHHYICSLVAPRRHLFHARF